MKEASEFLDKYLQKKTLDQVNSNKQRKKSETDG